MHKLRQDATGMRFPACLFRLFYCICSSFGATERNTAGNAVIWGVWTAFIWSFKCLADR